MLACRRKTVQVPHCLPRIGVRKRKPSLRVSFPFRFVFAAASVTAGRVPACPLPSHAYCHAAYPSAFLQMIHARPSRLAWSIWPLRASNGDGSRDHLELAAALDRPGTLLISDISEKRIPASLDDDLISQFASYFGSLTYIS